MTADQFLLALSKYWRGLVALVLIGVMAALGFAATRPVLYESSSTVYVSADQAGSRGGIIQSSHYVDTAVQSLAKVGTTPAVLGPVARTLGLRTTAQQLAERVSVDVGTNTVVLTVRALAATPADSVALANAVRSSLARQQSVLSTRVVSGAGLIPALTVHTVSAPRLPTAPESPNLRLIVATGLLLGLLLGLLYAVVRQLVRTRVISAAELRGVRGASTVPVLGEVGPPRPDGRAPTAATPNDDDRAILLHLGIQAPDGRTLVVSGAGRDDSASTVARGIASAAAERTMRVVLVDADLRRPTASRPVVGLAEVLQGTASLPEALQERDGLTLLSSGSPSIDPGALIASDATRQLLGALAERFDLVVVGAPAVLTAPDALGLARTAGGAILTARGGATRVAEITRSIESLRLAGVPVAGLVFERSRGRRTAPSATRSDTAQPETPDNDHRAAPATRSAPAGADSVSSR